MIETSQSSYPADMARAARPQQGQVESVANDLLDTVKQYAQEKPVSAALWALGIGFLLGWKLRKPW